MKCNEILLELKNVDNDEYGFIDIDHKRRPRITLMHLQKLRKVRGIEELEKAQRLQDVARIYGSGDEE